MHEIGRRRALLGGSSLLFAGLPGCLDAGSEAPDERGPLEIGDFAFAGEEPAGYGQYTEQPDAQFSPGDTMWLYVELEGLAARPAGDDVEIDLGQRVVMEHAEHGQISEDEFRYDRELQPGQLERFYVKNELPLQSDTARGEYSLSVTFSDAVSGTEASQSGTFHVVE